MTRLRELSTGRGRRFVLRLLALAAMSTSGHALFGQQPTFRSSVDLIAVDVQVVDRLGMPVQRLGPEAFEVTIRGQRRRVVSADVVQFESFRVPLVTTPGTSLAPPPAPRAAVDRTIVVAFDTATFEAGTEGPPLAATRAFLERLRPDDRVGLAVLPAGVWIPPTLDRARLRVALDRVVGRKPAIHSTFNLHPWEIVDITALATAPNSFMSVGRGQVAPDLITATDPVLIVQRRECPGDVDCPSRIYQEGLGLATQLEQEMRESLGGIEFVLGRLAALPGRKTMLLVSAGLVVSDRVDARPDPGKMAELIGQSAAKANTTVYTIQYETASVVSAGAAAQRGVGSTELSRDRALRSRWLDEFSDGAGGKRLYVPTGQGDFAFDQAFRELASYYLLGTRRERPRRQAAAAAGEGCREGFDCSQPAVGACAAASVVSNPAAACGGRGV
jgi:VWFA-related protein